MNPSINAIVHYQNMPPRIKALSSANDDGSYTIIINARLSYIDQRRAFAHELQHISGGDLENIDMHCDLIEAMIRMQQAEVV